MPRYVILAHDHPIVHWDLMLERDGVLRTWRLSGWPTTTGEIVADALGDHRLAYLDYEGPVSGGRGSVTRWDAGEFEWLAADGNAVRVRVYGKKLMGEIAIEGSVCRYWPA
jgi:hypothetical protein